MARLLVCAQTYPYPADQGGRIRYASLLEALERVHDVRLVLVRRESDALRHPASMAVDVTFSRARTARNSIRSLISSTPVQFGALVDSRSGAAVARAAGEVDAFVAFEPRAGLHHRFLPRDMPKVIDLPDSPVLAGRAQWNGGRGLLRRALAIENLVKVGGLERELVRSFDVICVAGPADARWISERFPGTDARVVPIAVTTGDTRPPSLERRVIFTGDLSFAPNADAVRFLVSEIWPRVLSSTPDAMLSIVGHKPHRALERFLASARCETAYSVPDIAPYVDEARVFVAPMRIGSGIKVKVLTAMAAGRPVVMTPLANEGIDARPGVEALIAAEPDALASAVGRLLADRELSARLGEAGRAFVSERFSLEGVAGVLLGAVETALERHGRDRPDRSERGARKRPSQK